MDNISLYISLFNRFIGSIYPSKRTFIEICCSLLFIVHLSAQSVMIPVVVHIVWHDPDENLSDSRVVAQIAALNRDFQLQNTDINLLPFAFTDLVANADIGFCLATIAPDGSQTNGITHSFSANTAIGSTFNGTKAIYYTQQSGYDAWPTEAYLNIWVSNMDGIEGFATQPDDTTPVTEVGVLVDTKVFGIGNETPANRYLGRTLVHEVGHFFGLQHPWGSTNDCTDDDGIVDTPSQAAPLFGCPDFPTTSCGNTALTHNFMQYTDDACRIMFTIDQKAKMNEILSTVRVGLTNSMACTTQVNELGSAHKATCTPNLSNDMIYVQLPEYQIDKSINILNTQGQLVQTTQAGSISIAHLVCGVYFIKWQYGTLRFVKI